MIVVLTVLSVFWALVGAAAGGKGFILGIPVSRTAGTVYCLLWAVVDICVAVGLVHMSRRAWWLAVGRYSLVGLLDLFSLLRLQMAAAGLEARLSAFGLGAEEVSALKWMGAAIVVFFLVLHLAIVAYLVRKRDLFGVDVAASPTTS